MSIFNRYATELNDIATSVFRDYTEAKQTLEEAKHNKEMTNPYDRIAMVKAIMAVEEAEASFKNAKANLENGGKRLEKVREDLSNAISEEYTSKPESVDSKAIELLKSGTMTGKDYEWMYNRAYEADNHTMVKIIGHYAENDERCNEQSKVGESLRKIIHGAKNDNGHEYLEAFDTLCGVYKRTANNPLMIEVWDGLTAELVEEF